VVRVAVGHTNPRRAEVAATAAEFGNVELIDQSQYVASLAKADIAVLAAGSSLWEAAALGVPTLALIVADNQVVSAQSSMKFWLNGLIDCRDSFNGPLIADLAAQILTSYPSVRNKAISELISVRNPNNLSKLVDALGLNQTS